MHILISLLNLTSFIGFNHDPKLPKEQAWRVTEVVPVAGELPLAENHTRAAHPGLNGSYKLANSHNGSKHRDVMMILHGGMYVGKNHSASLLFHCNHTAEEVCFLYAVNFQSRLVMDFVPIADFSVIWMGI